MQRLHPHLIAGLNDVLKASNRMIKKPLIYMVLSRLARTMSYALPDHHIDLLYGTDPGKEYDDRRSIQGMPSDEDIADKRRESRSQSHGDRFPPMFALPDLHTHTSMECLKTSDTSGPW